MLWNQVLIRCRVVSIFFKSVTYFILEFCNLMLPPRDSPHCDTFLRPIHSCRLRTIIPPTEHPWVVKTLLLYPAHRCHSYRQSFDPSHPIRAHEQWQCELRLLEMFAGNLKSTFGWPQPVVPCEKKRGIDEEFRESDWHMSWIASPLKIEAYLRWHIQGRRAGNSQ